MDALNEAIARDPAVAYFLGQLAASVLFCTHPLAVECSSAALKELKQRLPAELFEAVCHNIDAMADAVEEGLESGEIALPLETIH
ncbi:UNVERIFIED_ORG: hypothetical protein BDU10_3106 [Burkholderia sp. CF145]